MSPAARDHYRLVHRPALGILYMCAASTLFPIMNGIVQLLSARYSAEQLVWVRTAGHLVFVFALFAPQHGLRILATRQLKSQVLRSILLLSSTVLFFAGIGHIPLAQAATIGFTGPFVVMLLGWPMLGERVTMPRLIGVVLAFSGVLVVIRPGSDMFQPASLLIVGSAVCYAVYQIYSRRVAGHDRPETSVIYSALVGSVVMFGFAAMAWKPFHSWMDVALMMSLGILGGVGHYFVDKAMTYAPANVVAPFVYWQLVGSVIMGYILWSKWPDAATWFGAAIVVVAGLYVAWLETREKAPKTLVETV
jgi:drug/metabolite transporter (DMT)-like permease